MLADLLYERSRIEERLGRYPQSLAWATRARRIVEPLTAAHAATKLAELTTWYATVLQAEGRSRAAIAWAERGIELAQAIGAQKALGLAYNVLDWAKHTIGEPTGGVYWRRSLAIAEEIGNLERQAEVTNSIGYAAFYEGRWDEALAFYERSRELFATIGDPVSAEVGAGNIAEILAERGRLEEADGILRDSLRVWRASEYRYFLAGCLSDLGRVAARTGRFDEAIAMLDEARTLLSDVGAEGELIDVLVRTAECRVLMGDGASALEILDDAGARIGGTDASLATPSLDRVRGYALAECGRMADAREAFESSLSAARAQASDLDVANALHALIRLAELGGDTPSPQLGSERDRIVRQLRIARLVEGPFSGFAA